MVKRSVNTEHLIFVMLQDCGPLTTAAISEELGIKISSASNYLGCLKLEGRVFKKGLGANAIWSVNDDWKEPDPFPRVSSIWHYANLQQSGVSDGQESSAD